MMDRIIDPQTGKLRLAAFEKSLLGLTHDLSDVLAAARTTHSPAVESTHVLMALAQIPGGKTAKLFRDKGIPVAHLIQGLTGAMVTDAAAQPPAFLALDSFSDSGRLLLETLQLLLEGGKWERIDEGLLLMATLKSLPDTVVNAFSAIKLNPNSLASELEEELIVEVDYKLPAPFANDVVNLKNFSPMGRRVLNLMRTEAESLGYIKMDPRHLLLALVEMEGGATQMLLHQQQVSPVSVQQALTLNLRGARQNTRTDLTLAMEHLDHKLTRVLELSAEETRQDHTGSIAEVHLLRSLLRSGTFALRVLVDTGVDLPRAREAARELEPMDELSKTPVADSRTPEDVAAELRGALVGQDDVIEMCLPFIRRMLFGFRRQDKPAGVMLFCGPSGSGKTEMAKAIARAVFGSQENLIMLEMGQFQAKENMNTFVGAPPGYIGYGEGKLTNGLRDKPRSVVLFDEVEKAHPQVFDALLRFIDEGKIDDPAGPIRDGSQCIIAMTSNVGTKKLETMLKEGVYKQNKWQIRSKLKQALLNLEADRDSRSPHQTPFRFRPEFLNRIDEILLFNPLSANHMGEIARRYLEEYRVWLEDQKQVTLSYSPTPEYAAQQIGRFCANLDEGARATQRVTQTAVMDPVIDYINEKSCSPPVSLVLHFKDCGNEEPRGGVELLDG